MEKYKDIYGTPSLASQAFNTIVEYREWILLMLFSRCTELANWERQLPSNGSLDDFLEMISQRHAADCARHLQEIGELSNFTRFADFHTMNRHGIGAEIARVHNELSMKWFNKERYLIPAAVQVNYPPTLQGLFERFLSIEEADVESPTIEETDDEQLLLGKPALLPMYRFLVGKRHYVTFAEIREGLNIDIEDKTINDYLTRIENVIGVDKLDRPRREKKVRLRQ